ncbi:MAG TPA: hypothetical protein VNN76_07995 [Bacteroidota bacterium]|nr:hypothetical protein [Bacteroidota bacterium]
MTRKQLRLLLILVQISLFAESVAQHVPSKERVDPSYRRRTEIDGNNVRTSVFNFCFSGRTGVGQGVPYEWPKNTNRYYVALVGLFVGAEVRLNNGNIARIVDLPTYRQNPQTGGSWNLEPIPGYFNLAANKIAKSDEPATWPAFWPDKLGDAQDPGWAGKWNGYFGKDQFSADQEMYFRVGDDNYNRPVFDYTPDDTDPTRRGLGLIIDTRVMEWSQASVADAVFFVHEIKNDGTKLLPKTAVTLWLADFVGGDGDSQDDSPSFDLLLDIAFSLDSDGVSSNPAFQGTFVGAAATLYLETPGNATDKIDNDGDGEPGGSKILPTMLGGEIKADGVDNNRNGLIDEDSTHVPFGVQVGVGFADGIDNDGDGEVGSPTVTSAMVTEASSDNVNGYQWKRWPPNSEADAVQDSVIHLIDVGPEDVGRRYKDNIDNDGNSLGNWPTVTQLMIDQAASDPYKRYRVPGTTVFLYDVGAEDLGKKYINRDGARDPNIDEGIDEMIDESRDDGYDNDSDWNPLTDDVGLDGAPNTGDPGEGDGKPTSGANTPFPGEPNIDKTDVAEADQIGLTNVQYLPAGAIDFSTTPDIFFWASFMLPGSFVNPALIPTGESDLFVSSGVFPLRPGQIERISYAVVFGNAVRAGNARASGAMDDALRKREYALLAYTEDYQFAQAPLEPTLKAVPGDRKVTLYWDDVAEQSVDRFLQGIPGAPARDFQGYKIYRSTDPAFEDARLITDAFGNPAPFLKALVTFDRKDGIKGFHPVSFNGVQFDLGNDTGILHSWTDTTVQNGQKYYYAIRAYDEGYAPLQISPAESNLRISIDNVTGEVRSIGKSVVIVTPEAPVAGYVPPQGTAATLVQGNTTGKVRFDVVDPRSIRANNRYRVVFEDTVISGGGTAPDTFKTKNYSLINITNQNFPDTLIRRNQNLQDGAEQPLTQGFRLILQNEKTFGVNPALSGWNRTGVYDFDFKQWKGGAIIGLPKPADYKVIFGSANFDTSTAYTVRSPAGSTGFRPAVPVNFKVFNISENKEIEFAFWELNTSDGGPGIFSADASETDIIIFLERDLQGNLVTTWSFRVFYNSSRGRPVAGDTATIVLSKIFRGSDVFEFTTTAATVDTAKAKSELDRIKVVPNPYVAAATWEERNPFATGRGPRSIHFIHLPQRCTIRIYTVNGELVATIEHDSTLLDGTAEWNLLSRDQLSVSYGVYIYHIEAPGIGEKIGKFAVIK